VVLYENGISPIKKPNPIFKELPNPVRQASIEVNGQVMGTTAVLHDIEKTAIENLDEKYAGLIAKKVAGVVVRAVIADQVARQTNSPLLGALTSVALSAANEADLRSWNLLPRDLQVARVVVDPGTYTVRVLPSGAGPLPPKTIQLNPGEKKFMDFRYMP